MAEQRLFIKSGSLKLEALLDEQPGERAVVVTHPHPLYGGEMSNDVVGTAVEAYRENGFTTLRFNFRGVGSSEGSYDDGNGEQEDVRSCLDHLSLLGKEEIDLAGYSFGAWVNALGMEKFPAVRSMVMISPPVSVIDFGFLRQNPKIRLVIAGDRDEIASHDTIENLISVWNPEALFRVIRGADHFYTGKTAELKSAILEFLR